MKCSNKHFFRQF